MRSETRTFDAKLLVWGAGEMTDDHRRSLATWLRRQANNLTNNGHKYAKTFTARIYKPGEF